MPTVLIFSRHTAEDCPMNNERMKKMSFEFTSKLAELAKKHGVRIAGNWAVMPEHLVVIVLEAPTLEDLQRLQVEPTMMKWFASNTTEIKIAMTVDEARALAFASTE